MREMADAGNPGGSVPEDERHTVRARARSRKVRFLY